MLRSISLWVPAGLMLAVSAQAAQLAPTRWTVTELGTEKNVTQAVTDNNPDTAWTSAGSKGLLIDLGQEAVVHRVYILSPPPPTLRLSFLTSLDGNAGVSVREYVANVVPNNGGTGHWYEFDRQRPRLLQQGKDWIPGNKQEVNLKFNPAHGRYIKIEGLTNAAEIEIYGSTDKAAFGKGDAVVLATNAPPALRLAADELRYYVSELTGRPIPVVASGQEAEYPGTLYRIEDLKFLANTYEEMAANLKAGKLPGGGPVLDSVVSLYTLRLPDGVNVEKDGRSVVFRAWPYRNVAYSVWEFLRRQGVVWAYPDLHSEYVPAGRGVNLDILPLCYRPAAELREAKFDIGRYYGVPCPDDFLFFLRNGYGEERFAGIAFQADAEVPAAPQCKARLPAQVPPEYAEGFEGYPHNFSAVIPNRILEQHPDWCGMRADGQRLPPHKGGPGTFCMTSPGAIDFVADKMLAFVGDNKDCIARFNLLPMDGCTYCQCERCLKLYQPYEKPDIPYVPISPYMVSDAYYHFVSEVAKRVGTKAPHVRVGAMAYADTHAAPRKIARLPDNVWVEVVQYGSRNLPMSSPANAAMRQCQVAWARACGHFIHYEYALIHGEWAVPTMPIPLVSGIVDRSAFLHERKAWNGGTQSGMRCLPHNPWNHYAYVRMLWDVNVTADQITEEFFTAYYREAKAPMLAYYRSLEDHLIRNNVNLQDVAYDQGPNPDAFPPALADKLRGCLAEAGKAAASAPWYVQRRVRTAREDLEWGIAAATRRSLDLATATASGKKIYSCHRRNGAITIDGKLDDEGWKGAPLASDFVTPGERENKRVPDSEQTGFRMTWDDENLYLAVRCSNTNMASLKAGEAVWGTDNFEWFLVPEQAYAGAGIYQTALSAFNRSFGPDRHVHDQWHKDLDWKAKGLETAVQRGDAFWTAELALPFKALKEGAPKAGDHWRFNICRNSGNGVSRAGSWSPLLYAMWHQYHDFNFVVFDGDGK